MTRGAQPPGIPALPSPALGPEDVVLAQLDGLRREPPDAGASGDGLRACWEFASPGHRAATGPLGRFALMLRSPHYVGLLGHRTVHLGPLVLSGDDAHQEVLVLTSDDRTEGYTWVLSRQEEPPFAGCWMTDGVVRHDRGAGT